MVGEMRQPNFNGSNDLMPLSSSGCPPSKHLFRSSNREGEAEVAKAGAVETEGLLFHFTDHAAILARPAKHDPVGGNSKFGSVAHEGVLAIQRSRRAEQKILGSGKQRSCSRDEGTEVKVKGVAGNPGADAAGESVNVQAITRRKGAAGIDLAIGDRRGTAFGLRVSGTGGVDAGGASVFGDVDDEDFPPPIGGFAVLAPQGRPSDGEQAQGKGAKSNFAQPFQAPVLFRRPSGA